MISLKKILSEAVNEGIGREAMGIAGFTGTRGIAVQKFIDDFNLNAKKLFNFISKGKLKDRMDFATAISGKPGNKYQGNFVGMFGESKVTEATLTEKKYYVTYNKGRGQGKDLEKEFDQKTFKTTNKPKVFNSYNDAKKYAEKMEKMFRNSIGGGTAYWVSDEKMNPIKEASHSDTYFDTFTDAAEFARKTAEKKGFEIDTNDWHSQVTMGGRYSRARPSVGKTTTFTVNLLKNNKPTKKYLHFQVYGMQSGKFELNNYIGS